VSNLYGIATNPFNTRLTPGGSSGGEAALVAMRGSVLGIGTDIGKSMVRQLRVVLCANFKSRWFHPRAKCLLRSLWIKPSVARLPHGGLSGAHGGMENIIGVVGPLATYVEDMRLFCKVGFSTIISTFCNSLLTLLPGSLGFSALASRAISSSVPMEVTRENLKTIENRGNLARRGSATSPSCVPVPARNSQRTSKSRTHHCIMGYEAPSRSRKKC
jgi:hypothetical protein